MKLNWMQNSASILDFGVSGIFALRKVLTGKSLLVIKITVNIIDHLKTGVWTIMHGNYR